MQQCLNALVDVCGLSSRDALEILWRVWDIDPEVRRQLRELDDRFDEKLRELTLERRASRLRVTFWLLVFVAAVATGIAFLVHQQ
jgi:hypothetical protein